MLTTFDLACDGPADVASEGGMYTAGGQVDGMSPARFQIDVVAYAH